MEDIRVKQIMVPLAEYATVSDSANLMEAIRAMENKNKRFEDKPYRHRVVLVLDKKKKVIGKVGQVDIMRALEPNYNKIGTDVSLSRFGFSATFMNAIRDQFNLWQRPLEELCRALEQVRVTEVMYTPADHQRVSENDTLQAAMHQFVMGRHRALLVTAARGKRIVGILRSTDVFNCLCDETGICKA
ncbi:MAG: CBS domain-containing protein [Desulfobacterales bacterium]|nr:CBS domain-containing protein [Desulfobacterales bacterium]